MTALDVLEFVFRDFYKMAHAAFVVVYQNSSKDGDSLHCKLRLHCTVLQSQGDFNKNTFNICVAAFEGSGTVIGSTYHATI